MPQGNGGQSTLNPHAHRSAHTAITFNATHTPEPSFALVETREGPYLELFSRERHIGPQGWCGAGTSLLTEEQGIEVFLRAEYEASTEAHLAIVAILEAQERGAY